MGKYSAPRKPDTVLGRPKFGYRQPDTDRMDRLPPNVDPRMLEFDPRVYNPSLFFPNRAIDIKGAASDIPGFDPQPEQPGFFARILSGFNPFASAQLQPATSPTSASPAPGPGPGGATESYIRSAPAPGPGPGGATESYIRSAPAPATGGNFFDRFDPPPSDQVMTRFETFPRTKAGARALAAAGAGKPPASAPPIGPWELFQERGAVEHGPWELFGQQGKSQEPHAGGNFFDQFDVAPVGKAETGAERGTSVMDKIDAAVRGVADTATFGMADRIAAGLGALTGVGGTAGDYSANLAGQRALNQFDVANNAAPRIAGQLAGGLVVPGAAAAGGATLAARMGRGALAGAGQGALYGAGSSEDLTNLPDVAKNAAIGVGIGGALGGVSVPVAGALAGGVNRLTGTARGIVNPGQEAARRVAGALTEDFRLGGAAISPAAFDQAQRLGQPVAIGDLGAQTTQALARSAANTSPAARQAIEGVVQPRFEEQSGRIAEFLGTLGAGNTTQTLDKLQAAARAANRPLYAKAFAEGEKGIWNEGLSNLMDAPVVQDAVKAATRTGANRAVSEGFRPVKAPFEIGENGMLTPRVNPDGSRAIPSLQFWDAVKRNLDDKIGGLLRSGEKSAAQDATTLRSQLVGYMDRASPSYARARGTAAQFFGAEDALEAGAKFVSARGTNDSFRPAISKMSGPERELFAHGFASELANTALKTPDSSDVVRRIAATPQSRERLEMALGPQRVQKLIGFLATESAMNVLRRAVQGNSTTARQLHELGLAGGAAGIDYFTGSRGTLTAGTLGLLALRRGVKLGTGSVNRNVAESVGKLLASDSPQAMKHLSALAAKSNRVRDVLLSITPRAVSAIVPVILNERRSKSLPRTNPSARLLQPMTQ